MKKIKIFGLGLLTLLLVACSIKAGAKEFVEKNNEIVKIINTHFQLEKDKTKFEASVTKLESAIKVLDDLEMNEKNEEISNKLVNNYNEMLQCIKVMNKNLDRSKNSQVKVYNKQVIEYNKLNNESNQLVGEVE